MAQIAHTSVSNDLSADYVRSRLDYDPKTGLLTWKKMPYRNDRLGKPAGTLGPDGRIFVGFNRRHYSAHRLIWLIMTGEWPTADIDHRDRDASNNRWINLRLASASQNIANSRRRRDNNTGFKGVRFRPKTGRYIARIVYQRKEIHIGMFDTAEDAYAARCAKARELFGEFGDHVNA